MSRFRNYLITLNNYTEKDCTQIEIFKDTSKYLIICKEIAPTTGTKHLHIGLFLKNPTTTKALLKKLTKLLSNHPNLTKIDHIKGTIEYCKKSGEYVEYGKPPIFKGKRTDIEQIKKLIEEGENLHIIKKNYGNSSNFKFIENYYKSHNEYINTNKIKDYYNTYALTEVQNNWLQLLKEQDNRKILFIIDYEGNNGKSYFTQYMVNKYKTLAITGGKSKDLAFQIQTQEYLVYDCPRSGVINYHFIECCKNGMITSSKYQSTTKQFLPMKIIVMTNSMVDTTQLSKDRYQIIKLGLSKC